MKKVCVFLAVLLFLGATFAVSQPVPGKKYEFSTALSFFSEHYSENGGEYTGSWSYLNIPVRFGWFFWKNFEIEPEFALTIPFGDSSEVAYFFSASLLYNFKTKGKFLPFAGGGAGFGNGLPDMGYIYGGTGTKTSAVHGTVGVRYLLGKIAAIRAEYRLSFYRWNEAAYEYRETGTIHQILVGLSIFF